MRLWSGLTIGDPWGVLQELLKPWYPIYDEVVVRNDSQLRPEEIALSIMLNSQISGNTGGLIWLNRACVERALTLIPNDLDLMDIPARDPIPGLEAIKHAVDALCALRRVKLGVSGKILHKKRPALIPIFDSRICDYYHKNVIHRWPANLSSGDKAVRLIQEIHRDLLSSEAELREVHARLATEGTPLTHLRILDYYLWKAGATTLVL